MNRKPKNVLEPLPRIAITMGDPAGIGPEIIVKAFRDGEISRCSQSLVVGDAACLEQAAARYGAALRILPIHDARQARFDGAAIEVLDLRNVPENFPVARATAEGGKASMEYIRTAADLALQDRVDAITTAPINKKGIHLAGFTCPGHTEFLAEYTRTRDFALMMAGRRLRVVLVTNHIPLQKVPGAIDKNLVARIIRLTHRWLSRFVAPFPKIAVAGVNPHCGEDGIFGEEENAAIGPAISETQSEGIQVTGPHPADSLFLEARSENYDAVIAMYHDQGLVPVKMESMGRAVNLTLGLPIIRTSVDHGTAYGIVGRGEASPESLIEAVKTAASLCRRREELSPQPCKTR
ncbi:MAG: 4-hydroxythreonine-4-phosphate dehydrogenase PdxA [Nitrospinales bacterium]